MPTEETLNVRFTHTNEDTSVKSIYYPETTIDQVNGLNTILNSMNSTITLQGSNFTKSITDSNSSIVANNDSIRALNAKDSILSMAYDNATLAVESLRSMSEISSKTISIPEQNNILIYKHGDTLTPSFNNYDKARMTITSGTSVTTEAGHYTVCFTTSQYYFPNGQKTIDVGWDINKYTIIDPVLKQSLFDYDPKGYSIEFASDTVGYSITGDTKGTVVGDYTVKVKPKNKNYQWSNGTDSIRPIVWSITSKGGLKVPIQINSFIYDGSVKNITVPGILSDYEADKMSLGGVFQQSLANSYVASVAIKDPKSYAWADGSNTVKSISWKINKQEINPYSVTLVESEYQYSGGTIKLTESDFNGFDKNKMSIAGGNTGSVVGDYKVTINAKPNYVWVNGNTTLSSNILTWSIIEHKLVEEPALKKNVFPYELNTKYTVELQNKYGVTMTGDVSASEAGSAYVVKVSPTDNNSWPDGTVTPKALNWTIEPKSINTPSQSSIPTYNGSVYTVTSYLKDYDSKYMKITNGSTQKVAGTYNATIALTSTRNLRWRDTNSVGDKVISWQIKKVAIAPPSLATNSWPYDNKDHSIGFSNSSSVGMSILSGSKTSGKSVEVYHVSVAPAPNYEWNTKSDKDKIYDLTWKITSTSIFAVPEQTSIPEYTAKSININDTKYWTGYDSTNISMGGVTSGTNANTYSAIFKLKNSTHMWADNTKTNKTVKWAIGNKTITPTMTADNSFKIATPITGFDSNDNPIITGYATFKPEIQNSLGMVLSGAISANTPGFYKITGTPSLNYAFQGNAKSATFSWTYAAALDSPSLYNTKLRYDPLGKTINIQPTSILPYVSMVSGASVKTARGNYTVVLKPKSTYVWKDTKKDNNVTLYWTITYASLNPNISLNKDSFEYSGSPYTVSTSGGVGYSITGATTGTAAKTYIVSIKPANTNYAWGDTTNTSSIKTLKWTINPKKLAIPSIVVSSKLPVYDGKTSFKLEDYVNTSYDTSKMSLDGTTALNVPTLANASVGLKDTTNYTWSDGKNTKKLIQWSIRPATVDTITVSALPTFKDNTTFTIQDYFSPKANTNLVSWTGTAALSEVKNASVTLSLKNKKYSIWNTGGTADRVVEWSIKPATLDKNKYSLSVTSFKYDGKYHNPVLIGDTSPIVVASNGESLTSASKFVKSSKNIGDYEVTVTPDTNHVWKAGNSRVNLLLPWRITTSDNYEYDVPTFKTGSAVYNDGKSISVTDTKYWNNYDSSVISIGGTTSGSTVSTYSATFTLRNSNYRWSDGTSGAARVKWNITPKEIKVPSFNKKHTITFDGKTTVNVTQSGILNDYNANYVSIVSGSTASRAIITSCVFRLKDKANYIWEAINNTNDQTVKWSINPVTVNPPNIKAKSTLTYNNATQSLTSILENYNSNLVAISGTYTAKKSNDPLVGQNFKAYTATFTIKDTVSCIWSGTTKTSTNIDWYIYSATVSDPKLSSTLLSYDTNNKAVSPALDSNSTVYSQIDKTNGTYTATNAGKYSLYVKVKDANAYKYSNNTISKTIDWSIKPNTVEVRSKISSLSYEYGGKLAIYNVIYDIYLYDLTAKKNAPSSVYYSLQNESRSGVDAGKYTTKIELSPLNYGNYVFAGNKSTVNVEWTITPKKITVTPTLKSSRLFYFNNKNQTFITAATSKEFDGLPESLSLVYNGETIQGSSGTVFTVEGTAKNIGTHHVGIKYAPNYTHNGYKYFLVPWTIKASTIINPALKKSSYVYNNAEVFSISLVDSVTVGASIRTGSVSKQSVGGTYTVTVDAKAGYYFDNNYTVTTKTLTWTINPMTIVANVKNSSLTFNDFKVITPGGFNVYKSGTTQTVNPLFSYKDDQATTVGTYHSTLTISNTKSLIFAGNKSQTVVPWTVNPKNITTNPTLKIGNSFYETGSNITFNPKYTDLSGLPTGVSVMSKEGDTINSSSGGYFTVHTAAKAAGTYYAAIKYGPNYKINGYVYKMIPWYIKANTIVTPALKTTSFTYNASIQTVALKNTTGMSIKGGTTYATTVGTYNVTVGAKDGYVFDANLTKTKTLTWTINKQTWTKTPSLGNVTRSFYYDKKSHTFNGVIGTNITNVPTGTNGAHITVGVKPSNATYTASITATNIGTYYALIDFYPNYTHNGNRYYAISWSIKANTTVTPALKTTSFTYKAGTSYTVALKNTTGMSIRSGSPTNKSAKGTYTVTVDAKDGYVFDANLTKTKTLTWKIS